MSKEKIYIFDTTLREGAQTEGVDFSLDDKTKIASSLSEIGIDYIEGGWPGANPSDTNFFNNPPNLESNLVAFGMTKKSGRSCENDPGISSIVNAKVNHVCIVGKAWDYHVDVALGIPKEENLNNIKDTNIKSEGLVKGTIQVPADGCPIILLSDHGTIGGYPKIGVVISADYDKLVQITPGSKIKFKEIKLKDAENLYKLYNIETNNILNKIT